jgi:hypothetical protein
MYGWDQIAIAFDKIALREEASGSMPKQSSIISYKWFPASHIDFYVARPSNRMVFVMGEMNDIHKYAWINKYRGGLQKGNDYFHIAVSNNYKSPNDLFGNYFKKIEPIDTIEIKRDGKIMRYAFFYRMKNYNGNFVNPLP